MSLDSSRLIKRYTSFLAYNRFIALLFLIFVVFHDVKASHIVGGEFQIVPVGRGSNYQITLRVYFDYIHGDKGLWYQDLAINAGIFRKSDDRLMQVVNLKGNFNGVPSAPSVDYQFPACSTSLASVIETKLLKYVGNVYLDPNVYDDPGGYYIVWERCCRNEAIKNIVDPYNTGQAFYLEFPAISRNGLGFKNSSPLFGDIKANVFCANEPNYFDFGAIDPDGDSLTYELVTPLAGHADLSDPEPSPDSGPYYPVTWEPGYSASNTIPGNPPLKVDPNTGRLYVTPSETGLYVLSMICKEFRNGEQIGQVRRDFQFLIQNCEKNYSPSVKLKDLDTGTKLDTFKLYLNENKCFSISVTDSNWNVYGERESIYIKGISTNLPSSIFTPPQSGVLQAGNDTIRSSFCFDPCDKLLIDRDSTFDLQIIVADDGCPLVKTDTLNIKVLVLIPDNVKPTIGYVPFQDPYTIFVGEQLDFIAYAIDTNETDRLDISAAGLDFNMDSIGMSFPAASGKDSVGAHFTWNPNCNNRNRTDYSIVFTVDDHSCIYTHRLTDTIEIRLREKETTLPSIIPVNLTTPNADGKNDYFEIPNMPEDNCEFFFKSIIVYNRWGGKVYESTKRDFKWDPTSSSDGVYFYHIDLNKKLIKGWVQVVR